MEKMEQMVEEREEKGEQVNVNSLRDVLKGYEVVGKAERFQETMCSLMRWLQEKRVPVWQLFTPVRS